MAHQLTQGNDMSTKEQVLPLADAYAEAHAIAEWQSDQGWVEAHIADCHKKDSEARAALEAALDAADAENAKLRDALEKLARLGNGDQYGNSIGNEIARTALGDGK
jgi:hypothetical protein